MLCVCVIGHRHAHVLVMYCSIDEPWFRNLEGNK
jgi:hypothetical protein